MICRSLLAVACSLSLSAQAVQLLETNRMLPPLRHGAPATIGDVTGDGLPDVVFVPNQLFMAPSRRGDVWLASVQGRFVAIAGAVPSSQGRVSNTALVDVDADGDLDLATGLAADCFFTGSNCSNGGGELFLNNGSGSFRAAATPLPVDPAAITRAVVAGDVDGDGDRDLVHVCAVHTWSIMQGSQILHFRARGENWLFLNNGAGVFTAAPGRLGSEQDTSTAAVLADFDRDGDLDLFVGNAVTPNFGGGQDKLYRNDGVGNFAPLAGALPVETEDALGAWSLDADRDGDQDLLVQTSQGLRLRLNNGAASFVDATANLPALAPVNDVVLGDWNRDGATDLAVRSDRVLMQLRNTGAGVFVHLPSENRDVSPMQLLPGDVDGDGDLDLVLPGGDPIESQLLLNDGRGSWLPVRHSLPEILDNQLRAVPVDLDRDGDLDVVAPSSGSPHMVYVNDGTGSFARVAYGQFSADSTYGDDVAVGDFDADGFVDVVVAVPLGLCQIYRNTGTGRLDRVTTPQVSAMSVATGDLDNDGDLDMFMGSSSGSFTLVNQGGFNFTVHGVNDPPAAADVALADLDRDGDLDAVAAGWFGVGNRVLLNNGAGVFTVVPNALPNPSDDSRNVLVVDVDGDADLDLVFSNDGGATPQPNRLYRNDGTGRFVDSSQDLPGPVDRSFSHAAGDFDQDGDLDLLECNIFSQQPSRLLANDGAGRFSEVVGGLSVTPYAAHQFLVADFDRDDDLDAFLVSQGPAHHYRNLRRQIAWRELPRIARPLTLDVYGLGNQPFAFVASAARVDLPVPGLGRLMVDPAAVVFSDLGTLDANGRAARSYVVPDNASLLGLRLYWQALIGTPPRLSNVEAMVLQQG